MKYILSRIYQKCHQHMSKCSQRAHGKWRFGRELQLFQVMLGNECCPDPGYDLMTSREKPTFSFLHPEPWLPLHLHVGAIKTMFPMSYVGKFLPVSKAVKLGMSLTNTSQVKCVSFSLAFCITR